MKKIIKKQIEIVARLRLGTETHRVASAVLLLSLQSVVIVAETRAMIVAARELIENRHVTKPF